MKLSHRANRLVAELLRQVPLDRPPYLTLTQTPCSTRPEKGPSSPASERTEPGLLVGRPGAGTGCCTDRSPCYPLTGSAGSDEAGRQNLARRRLR